MKKHITVILATVSLTLVSGKASLAINVAEYLNNNQIAEAIELKTIRLNKTVYGFFDNNRMLISNGMGGEVTKWSIQDNKLCFNRRSGSAGPQLLCAMIERDNSTKKMFFVFEQARDKHYEIIYKGNSVFGYEKAVTDLRTELLDDPSTTQEQRKYIQSEQARFDAGFADTVVALGAAYKKYMSIKRCYEDRRSYQAVYVTEDEYASSKNMIAAIEKYAKSILPSISTDEVWNDVINNPSKYVRIDEYGYVPVNDDIVDSDFNARRDTCQMLVSALAATYKKINPDAFKVKKDF